jgi:hypothetical protein
MTKKLKDWAGKNPHARDGGIRMNSTQMNEMKNRCFGRCS